MKKETPSYLQSMRGTPKIEPICIGLIADTHIPRDIKALPPHVKEAFKGVSLILHAGDIYLPTVLNELETLAPVLAAKGNGDRNFPEDHRLKETHILTINGLSLGLTHGINYPTPSGYSFDQVMENEFGQPMDIIVFGDTHVAIVERYASTLLINPGSPTLPNGLFELGTVGLLEITGNRTTARIIPLSEFPFPFHREEIYY
jgi:putative phosphoesterase